MITLRIFISSPGDVRTERVRAFNVVQKLQTKYRAFINLEPILWEHEAMSAFSTFQDQILPPSKTDVVICILWARIGKRLPPEYKRADGTIPSGTEWEFEDAYDAHRVKGTPDLYIYRKIAEARMEVGRDNVEEYNEWRAQLTALDGFLDRWLKNHDNSFKAAFNPFKTDEEFEVMLTQQLGRIVERKVQSDPSGAEPEEYKITWFGGSPFLGLQAFQPQHAPIFFGRDLDARKVLDKLKTQAGKGRVFLMILGMSGCGKSSLARAGVLPMLRCPGETGCEYWRDMIFRPMDVPKGLLAGLGEALLKALPEFGQSAEWLAGVLRDNPVHLIAPMETALGLAAKAMAAEKGLPNKGGARVFLLIDQFEEIFTQEPFRPEREAFVAALAALSRSGLVWIVATMRSDLYGHCTDVATLMELKGEDGQYDLTPPGVAELPQMIRSPARAAGLRYQVNAKTGQKLDDALLEEAWQNPEALPLLEFTLDKLYEARTENLLTWDAYEALGGMKGAIATYAEAEYQKLTDEGKKLLLWIFSRLVTFEQNHATAHQALGSEFASRPGADKVVQRFIDVKLFVTTGRTDDQKNSDGALIGMAHEALLESWPLLKGWTDTHRGNLKSHAAVTADTKRWLANNKATYCLYKEEEPLKRAEGLLLADFLTGKEQEFVRASLRNVAKEKFAEALAAGERMTEISDELRADYPDLRVQILREALHNVPDKTVPDTGLKMKERAAAEIRANAAILLGLEAGSAREKGIQGVEEVTEELVRLVVQDPAEAVRRSAATSLIQVNHPAHFEKLIRQSQDGSKQEGVRALAHVRVAADAVETPSAFEVEFAQLKPGFRSRIISTSRWQRLRRGWPTLFIVLIPALVLSSIFTAIFKMVPASLNYAWCQSEASAVTGFFDAIIACFMWGGVITFCLAAHRVVIHSELGRKSYLRPWGSLVAGAIGGILSTAMLVGFLLLGCNVRGTNDQGFTSKDWHQDWWGFWDQLLWQTRAFWPYFFSSSGLGIGMAATTNRLWSSEKWRSFLGKQSLLTGETALSLVQPLAKLAVPVAWPIAAWVLLGDAMAFYVVRTAPVARNPLAFPDLPKPLPINTWQDALLGGMAHNISAVTQWKMTAWGQGLGIFFDSVTQALGGFWCVVGMCLGLIAIRYGVKIEPRKN